MKPAVANPLAYRPDPLPSLIRPPIVFTALGWRKRRYPRLNDPRSHPYIGNGPAGGGGCIDCGFAGPAHDHSEWV